MQILPFLAGAVLLRGRGTITSIFWTMRGLVPGHSGDYWSTKSVLTGWVPCPRRASSVGVLMQA
jgi:hypothetical protein